jgi:hypothetical protein
MKKSSNCMGFKSKPFREIITAKRIWITWRESNKTSMMPGRNVEENAKNRPNNNTSHWFVTYLKNIMLNSSSMIFDAFLRLIIFNT